MRKRHRRLLKIVSNYLNVNTPCESREDILDHIIKLNKELKFKAPKFKHFVNRAFFADATFSAAIYIALRKHFNIEALNIANSIFEEYFRINIEESRITFITYSILHKIPFIGRIISFLFTRPNDPNGWIAEKGPQEP